MCCAYLTSSPMARKRARRVECAPFGPPPGQMTYPQGPPVIEFDQVHKTYRVGNRDIPALQPTRLNIESGEVFGLIGHSGAGKSTLLRLINDVQLRL